MNKKIIIFLSVMLVASFVTSIICVFFQYREDNEQEIIFEELENVTIQEESKKDQDKQSNNKEKINLQELYEINSDLIGWLKIENTNINYPVMQTDESRKDYYLRKNFYKEYSYSGTPYIAEYCNILKSDNLIIYGHNINRNRIFGELEKYTNKSFYNNHKIIEFNTIYEKSDYEIIAVFKTVAYKGFGYYKFVNSSSKGEFDTFIKKCKELSFYDTTETAEEGDKLITLSTCEYSQKNGRLVVIAKKIANVLEE